MTWMLHQYTANDELVQSLAQRITQDLLNAIDERGRASLAVSGGSTPVSLFRALASIDIPWSKVVITLVDERWVPQTHQDSNALLVHRHLLRDHAAKARFVGLKTEDENPFLAVAEVEAKLLREVFPLDVVVLGMGEDGHTASFFPKADGLSEALQSEQSICCGITPPNAPYPRMTLSLSALLGARQLFLHIIGAKKKRVLEAAIEPGPVTELPVRAVLNQAKVVMEIFYAEQD
tara:strand:+ start:1844 stop:2545 length:702 start_codon:yes stop_codon:yes gene_type:complete